MSQFILNRFFKMSFFFNHLQQSRLISDVPLTLFGLSRIACKAAKMPSRRDKPLGKLKKNISNNCQRIQPYMLSLDAI